MSGKISIRESKKRGSYIVETAIILPILIMAVLSIIIFTRVYQADWKINHIMKDEVALSSARAYLIDKDITLKQRVNLRIRNQGSVRLSKTSIQNGISLGERDNLIIGSAEYDSKFHIPMFDIAPKDKVAVACGRKFVGDKKEKHKMSFDSMERDDGKDIVFIFPKDGLKYHKSTCRTALPKAEETILDESILSKYSPCKICMKKRAKKGMKVLIFKGYGSSYHSQICSVIIKNIEKTRRDIAEEKGYEACKICKP